MGPGTNLRGPLSIKKPDGTTVQIADASGNLSGAGFSPSGDVAIAAGHSLTVTTADKLTVGGKIVPQTVSVSFQQAQFGAPAFIAPWACKVVSVRERHATAESTAGTLTAQLVKSPSGTAIGSGTNCLSAGINMKATANTNQSGTLSATPADYTLAAGDSLGVKLSGSATELASAVVTVELQRV